MFCASSRASRNSRQLMMCGRGSFYMRSFSAEPLLGYQEMNAHQSGITPNELLWAAMMTCQLNFNG